MCNLAGVVAFVHALVSFALIGLILLHAGKGGGVSDVFGGGMSSGGAVGGSSVVQKNLDRITIAASVIFVITTFTLTFLWKS